MGCMAKGLAGRPARRGSGHRLGRKGDARKAVVARLFAAQELAAPEPPKPGESEGQTILSSRSPQYERIETTHPD